jgi:hypothetical protein
MYAAALAEDPNAFDYDGVYDSIQQEKAAPKAQDKVARQPKYIANLLEQAQLRKREQDITTERRLVRCWLLYTVLSAMDLLSALVGHEAACSMLFSCCKHAVRCVLQ